MKNIRNVLLLILTALIWGVAFVAQTTGGDVIGPYSFNSIRSFMGVIVLLPVIKFLDVKNLSENKPVTKEQKKLQWKAGLVCGICLSFASMAQQLGLYLGTPAGKAGFLTTCYIVMVPILGLFLKKKCGINIWVAVAITLVGLYLLCMNGSMTLQFSDGLVLICAVLYACQILAIDRYVDRVHSVRLSAIQFLISGFVSAIPMVIIDIGQNANGFRGWAAGFATAGAWIALLYAGVMSCGVAYTLQIIAQKGLHPTVASLVMSMESVFSVLAGWLLLGQKLGARELIGCGLIFTAVILAQIEFPVKKVSEEIKA